MENAGHLSHLAGKFLIKSFESTFCSVGQPQECECRMPGSFGPTAVPLTGFLWERSKVKGQEVETRISLLNSPRLAGSREPRSYKTASDLGGLLFCSIAPRTRDASFTTSEPFLSESATDATWSTDSEQGSLERIYSDCHSRFLFPELPHVPHSPAASASAEPPVPAWLGDECWGSSTSRQRYLDGPRVYVWSWSIGRLASAAISVARSPFAELPTPAFDEQWRRTSHQ